MKNSAFEALEKSDLTALSGMLDNKVEICFDNKVQYLDKQATISAIKNFLTQNPPKSVTAVHNGAAKGNASQYTIGSFVSSNGKNYRVFVYTSDKGEKKIIQELKIDLQ
ncbi:MAG: DUF4783 domain-containing protein [Saprospiraceae bacterium]